MELRNEKLRVQALADAAEAAFHRVRFAAGVSAGAADAGTGGRDTGTAAAVAPPLPSGDAPAAQSGPPPGASAADEPEHAPPDPSPIISRFGSLEGELAHVEEALGDYRARLGVLTAQRAELEARREPRARDADDEYEGDASGFDALQQRVEAGRRTHDSARREADALRMLRLQLEQSVESLAERLAPLAAGGASGGGGGSGAVPCPPPQSVPPELAAADATSAALLRRAYAALPTAWCGALHERLAGSVTALQSLMRAMDVDEAAEAAVHAAHWLAAATQQRGADEAAAAAATPGTAHPLVGGGVRVIPSLAQRRASAHGILRDVQDAAAATGSPSLVGPATHYRVGAGSPVGVGTPLQLAPSPALGGHGGEAMEAHARAADAALGSVIEGIVGRHGNVVRERLGGSGARGGGGGGGGGDGGGSGGGAASSQRRAQPPPTPVTVSRKAITEAVRAFERSWKEGPAQEEEDEEQEATRAAAALHVKRAWVWDGGDVRSGQHPHTRGIISAPVTPPPPPPPPSLLVFSQPAQWRTKRAPRSAWTRSPARRRCSAGAGP